MIASDIQRVESSSRGVLLWLRWLFFLVLLSLFLYSPIESLTRSQFFLRVGILGGYALSNLLLTWASREKIPLQRWNLQIFLIDLIFIGVVLYNSVGPDTDLYIMCFVIMYLSTLGRNIRDALPLALIACLLYGLLLFHRRPDINLMNPHILLRFPLFLIFALFTSYLSQQTEDGRLKLVHMQDVQLMLSRELQKAERALQDKQAMLLQAEKLSAMGNMAGALAHEIRNPLSVIIGYVEDVIRERPSEETMSKILESVRRSAVRCLDLMNNLLTFARRPKDIECFYLKDALQDTLALVRMSAKMTQVQCILDARANPMIWARRGEIQQIFINLMGNAVDAMPQGGTLTVIVEEGKRPGNKNWATVSIQDTGTGISEDIRVHMFEPFYTTKPTGKGTGLGLSIVQDIVHGCHGVLTVESELHKGSTFRVHLPLQDTAPAIEDPLSRSEQPAQLLQNA